MPDRRPLAGTEVALIVEIYAVRDGVESARHAQFFHQREQFILTEEAALRIVAHIFGTIEFRGGDHFQRNRLLPRKGDGIGKLRARQAGRVGDDRQHVIPQDLMRGPRQVRRIHAAGIGDQSAAEGAKPDPKRYEL